MNIAKSAPSDSQAPVGIRDTLFKNKKSGIGFGIGLFLIAAIIFTFEMRPFSGIGGAGSMYVSADDGASFEKASLSHFPPYQSSGKEYVRAYVFNDGSKTFVGYLLKFDDAVVERLTSAQEKLGKATVNADSTGRVDASEMFVKRPGDHDWVPLSSANALKIQTVKDAQGQTLKPLIP